MGAVLVALLPIISGLIAGSSFGAVIGGLTVAQWITLAAALLSLETPMAQAEITKLHPIFAKLLADAQAFGPQTAAAKAKDNAERIAFGFEDPANPGMIGEPE